MLASFLLVLVCAQLGHGLSCHGGAKVVECTGDHDFCHISYWGTGFTKKCVKGDEVSECPKKDGCAKGGFPVRKICCCSEDKCNTGVYYAKDGDIDTSIKTLTCLANGDKEQTCDPGTTHCHISNFAGQYTQKCATECPVEAVCGKLGVPSEMTCCCSGDKCNTEEFYSSDKAPGVIGSIVFNPDSIPTVTAVEVEPEDFTCMRTNGFAKGCLPYLEDEPRCLIYSFANTIYQECRKATACLNPTGCALNINPAMKECCCAQSKCNSQQFFEKTDNSLTCMTSFDSQKLCTKNDYAENETLCQIYYYLGEYHQRCVNGESMLECPKKDGCDIGGFPERKICCCDTPNCNTANFYDEGEVPKPTEAPSGSWMLAGSGWVLMTSLVLGRM